MFEIASIFSVPPEAAAVISGAPGYESLTGYVLLYGAPGGTVVVAQLEGLPSGGFFALHLHQGESCRTIQEAFDGAGPIGACRASCTPIIWGICRFFWPRNGFAWSAVFTGRFLPSQARGRTVIVHHMPDDYRSQPAGDAGERIGCGVIW